MGSWKKGGFLVLCMWVGLGAGDVVSQVLGNVAGSHSISKDCLEVFPS